MRSGNPSQCGFGLINQLPHDLSYGLDRCDPSCGLSRPDQRFSTSSPPKSFDNLGPKAWAAPARFIPFSAPFIQKRGAQGPPDGAVADAPRHRNDVVDDLRLHRVLGVGLDDRLLPIIVNGSFFGRKEAGAYVDPDRSQHEGRSNAPPIVDAAGGNTR